MPAWIKSREQRLEPEMRKTYGPEKAKQVAFALATQAAHAAGQSPKTFHGKPFGTPEGRREAKAKYDEPSKLQKSAQTPPAGSPAAARPQKSASAVLDVLSGKTAASAIDDWYGDPYGPQLVRHIQKLRERAENPRTSEKQRLDIVAEALDVAREPGGIEFRDGKGRLMPPRLLTSLTPDLRAWLKSQERSKTAASAIDETVQRIIGQPNKDKAIFRPTATPAVMSSAPAGVGPGAERGMTVMAAEKTGVLEGFKKLFAPPPKKKSRGELIDLADEAASRSAVKWASLESVIPYFLASLTELRCPR